MHGSVAIFVLHVDVGALRHQQLHQFGVALRHRQLQRRLIAVVADVDVTSSLQKSKKDMKNKMNSVQPDFICSKRGSDFNAAVKT